MGLFDKNRKDKVIPNYRTVPSQNGPVIDVFCLNGEGYNTINADDNLLFLSGMTYWQMQTSAYGCDTDPDVARSNASRFFLKLWENGYYKKQPLVGWYMALYSVYHGNTWSDISRQAMKVFCEYFFQQKKLETAETWHISMMYTSMCGGSIDDVVGWLHRYMEKIVSKKLIWEGSSLVLPVLKHYKVLQGIVHQVPFDTPEAGGTLEGYWDYIADKFMCEDARLEAALVRIFFVHSPYKRFNNSIYDNEFMLDTEGVAEREGLKEEAALFNSAAKKGNFLALSFVHQREWIYETSKNKISYYPSFDKTVLANDDYIRQNRENVLQQLYSKANSVANYIAYTGLTLKKAEEHYAKGLYQLAAGERFYDEMKKAASYAEKLYDVTLPEGRLNAAVRAAVCVSLVFKEEYPFLTKADKENTSRVEKLAIGCRNKPTELKFRKLGILLRDGFMGMHPQPDLWDKFRFKALDTAKAYGITKYVLDEPDTAEMQFRAIIENSEKFWSEKHITGAWLGLAWLRYSKEDYSDLSELVTYLERYDGFDDIIGRDDINNYIRAIKYNNLPVIEPLAKILTQDRRIHNDDPVIIDMGRLVSRYLGCQYEKQMENCRDEIEKLALMTKVVDVEMLYAGYAPRLLGYIITGLDCGLEYFYGLLECKEVYDAVYAAVMLKPMLDYVKAAVNKGCDLKEQMDELQKKWDEAETRRILTTKHERPAFSVSESRPKSPWDEPQSLIDIIMDADERKNNEDGMTNEELFNAGKRGYLEHEHDKAVREGLKDPWGLFKD